MKIRRIFWKRLKTEVVNLLRCRFHCGGRWKVDPAWLRCRADRVDRDFGLPLIPQVGSGCKWSIDEAIMCFKIQRQKCFRQLFDINQDSHSEFPSVVIDSSINFLIPHWYYHITFQLSPHCFYCRTIFLILDGSSHDVVTVFFCPWLISPQLLDYLMYTWIINLILNHLVGWASGFMKTSSKATVFFRVSWGWPHYIEQRKGNMSRSSDCCWIEAAGPQVWSEEMKAMEWGCWHHFLRNVHFCGQGNNKPSIWKWWWLGDGLWLALPNNQL